MSATEFIVLGGVLIAGLFFISMVSTSVFEWGAWTQENIYKSQAKNIASLIERVSKEPNDFVYYSYNISLSNITIKNGILTYEKNNKIFSFNVPENVNESKLVDVSSLCIQKSGDDVFITEKCPECNMDSFCTPSECNGKCPDCYGPEPICIGDGTCNKEIGESCLNSKDCSCAGLCCPDSPDADKHGCSKISKLNKGDECYCDNQCSGNLKCNPTAQQFTSYGKACCEEGMSWDGSKCIQPVCKYPCAPGCKLPKKWDWRNVEGKNWLTPVRNQDGCGSCWAFSAVGAVEGTYNVEQNTPGANNDLSEQDLVSCSPAGSCNGGWHFAALNYIKSTGICEESCFPYRASDVSCGNKCNNWVSGRWKLKNYGKITGRNNIKRKLICEGPLSVALSMRAWNPGTYSCSPARLDHAVVVVGYDDTGGYWIVRNSWGAGWGDHGYFKVKYNQCGIESTVWYVQDITSHK